MKSFFLRHRDSLSFRNRFRGNSKEKKNTFILNCPHCDFSQEVLFSGLSTFCKNCHHVINIESVFRLPPLPEQGRLAIREVFCLYCKNEQTIPIKALSSFCKKCGKRINLQNYKITGKFNGALETQGDLLITGVGEFRGSILCYSAIVEGKIHGTLHALNKINLTPTALVKGSMQARTLVMEAGTSFTGTSKISP